MTMEGARAEMDDARRRAAAVWGRRRYRDSVLEQLQELIDCIEHRNLGAEHAIPEEAWLSVVELAGRLPVQPPRTIWQARTTRNMHAVLLEWQGAILDRTAPLRPHYGDRSD